MIGGIDRKVVRVSGVWTDGTPDENTQTTSTLTPLQYPQSQLNTVFYSSAHDPCVSPLCERPGRAAPSLRTQDQGLESVYSMDATVASFCITLGSTYDIPVCGDYTIDH